MGEISQTPMFEGMGHFPAVSADELVLLYRYMRDERKISEVIERGTPSEATSGVLDESQIIEELCSEVKQLTGDDIARGFSSSVHVLQFLTGNCLLPNPVADEGGSAPVLIAA